MASPAKQGLTGIYDTDAKIFEHMAPKDLARLRAVDKTTKTNVDRFVNDLVRTDKLVFTQTYEQGKMKDWDVKGSNAFKNNPAETLKFWGTGKMKKK